MHPLQKVLEQSTVFHNSVCQYFPWCREFCNQINCVLCRGIGALYFFTSAQGGRVCYWSVSQFILHGQRSGEFRLGDAVRRKHTHGYMSFPESMKVSAFGLDRGNITPLRLTTAKLPLHRELGEDQRDGSIDSKARYPDNTAHPAEPENSETG